METEWVKRPVIQTGYEQTGAGRQGAPKLSGRCYLDTLETVSTELGEYGEPVLSYAAAASNAVIVQGVCRQTGLTEVAVLIPMSATPRLAAFVENSRGTKHVPPLSIEGICQSRDW